MTGIPCFIHEKNRRQTAYQSVSNIWYITEAEEDKVMQVQLGKMKKFYRKLSISQKLFFSFSIMIAIPAIVLSFLFIRTQETYLYNDAIVSGSNHVAKVNEQIRSRMNIIESVSSIALTQKSFIDFIHSNMQSDGLRLVKFRQNQYEQMHNIVQSNKMISDLSFYIDNPNLYEIWPEIYHYDKFSPQDYWLTLKDEGGEAYRVFAFQNGEHTLSYYRLVRLQGQQQKRPSIMEIRVEHSVFFSDVLLSNEGNFFTTVMDGNNPNRYVYNSGHSFVQDAGEDLDNILGQIYEQLDVLEQESPNKVNIGDHTYYALYRYITPLNAYVVDIISHQALMKGPRNWYILVVLITSFVLLMMLLLVSQTTRLIFHRLDSVLSSMRKVRKGQLDAKIDIGLEENESGDEIDEVAISYNKMLDEIKHLMMQVVDKQLIAKNAQLHSLHSQINSHFLYNALESIRMLAEVERQQAIADAIVSLGSLLRYSMKWESDTVALREELANIESYIGFINFMDGKNFILTTDIPKDVLSYSIPKMCMQPIIENVVHHAAPLDDNVQIEIMVSVENNNQLVIKIQDNGVGITPEKLIHLQALLYGETDMPIVTSKNGLGLENVHKRIQLNYGKNNGLWIEATEGVYTCVTIRLPWENLNLGGW